MGMRTLLIVALSAGLLVAGTGCASNPIVGQASQRSEQYFGDVGITGHGNSLTILPGSRILKLSIIGNDNTITVEDNVTIYRIEFWGKNNTISIPDYLSIRTNDVGSNQIIRRARSVREPTYYTEPTPTYTSPRTTYISPSPAPSTLTHMEPATPPPAEFKPLPPEADMVELEPMSDAPEEPR
jgi:hypothetical protein